MNLELAGIQVSPAVIAPLDPNFFPASLFNKKYRELAERSGKTPLHMALERGDGSVSRYDTAVVPPSKGHREATQIYVERIVKFLLWQRGGWKLHVGGPEEIGSYIKAVYSAAGGRKFDVDFMATVYEHPFEVLVSTAEAVPGAAESSIPLGRHLDGCRVGFDLGASDRKASAVKDGEAVFSEEIVWDPKTAKDPEYHYQGVMDSIRRAAAHLPRLDAVGGSAAGVYINNRVRVGSLYRGVPEKDFAEKIAPLFLRIRDELGVPMEVVNDGEVTALAGSMSIGENPVLGIALGSSQAAGYVNNDGNITGWMNELAFAPVDYRPDGPVDEWSRDCCGAQYFSQQATNRVATSAGMKFPDGMGLPERLVGLQKRMEAGDELAGKIYETIGAYVGYGVAHYADFYQLKHVLILGRVTTGRGGDIILAKSLEVLRRDFPSWQARFRLPCPTKRTAGSASRLPPPACLPPKENSNEAERIHRGNMGSRWRERSRRAEARHPHEHCRPPGRRGDHGARRNPRRLRQPREMVHGGDRHQWGGESARWHLRQLRRPADAGNSPPGAEEGGVRGRIFRGSVLEPSQFGDQEFEGHRPKGRFEGSDCRGAAGSDLYPQSGGQTRYPHRGHAAHHRRHSRIACGSASQKSSTDAKSGAIWIGWSIPTK